MDEFKGAGGADLHTEGVPLAQVTFIGSFGFRMEQDHLNGAVLGAEPAADALLFINHHRSLVGSLNGFGRADIHAIGIFALVADHGDMIKVLPFVLDDQTGQAGIVSVKQGKGAGQLADAASGAFVKVGMNTAFDGSSS